MLKKRIDIKGLLVEDLLGIVWEKLGQMANDSSTPLDNAVLEFCKPEVEKYVNEKVDELLAKL